MNKSIEFKFFYYISKSKVDQLLKKYEFEKNYKHWLKRWKLGDIIVKVKDWIQIKIETPNISDNLYMQTLFIISELQQKKQLKEITSRINTEDFFIDRSLWLERVYDLEDDKIYALIKAYKDIVIVLIGSPSNIINEQNSTSSPTNIPGFLKRLELAKAPESSDTEENQIQDKGRLINLATFFLDGYENAVTYSQVMKTVLFDVSHAFDMANFHGIPKSFRDYKKIYVGSPLFTAN